MQVQCNTEKGEQERAVLGDNNTGKGHTVMKEDIELDTWLSSVSSIIVSSFVCACLHMCGGQVNKTGTKRIQSPSLSTLHQFKMQQLSSLPQHSEGCGTAHWVLPICPTGASTPLINLTKTKRN